MKPKFTPGPWGVFTSESGARAVFSGESGEWVATTCGEAWKTEDEANARLIAAAPELLAFASRAEYVLDYYNANHSVTRDSALCELYELARAALAKATGDQS